MTRSWNLVIFPEFGCCTRNFWKEHYKTKIYFWYEETIKQKLLSDFIKKYDWNFCSKTWSVWLFSLIYSLQSEKIQNVWIKMKNYYYKMNNFPHNNSFCWIFFSIHSLPPLVRESWNSRFIINKYSWINWKKQYLFFSTCKEHLYLCGIWKSDFWLFKVGGGGCICESDWNSL